MSGVYNGQRFEVPGVTIISWLDDPRAVRVTNNTQPRTQRISLIELHNTQGTATTVTPGAGPVGSDPFYYARDAATNDRRVSWDATVRNDGTVLWHNDPAERFTWHGNAPNARAIGIEIQTNASGKIYQAQVDAVAKLVPALAKLVGIQLQMPWKNGAPDRSVLARATAGGADLTGVIGHRNASDEKSDPGDAVFLALAGKGVEKFDFGAGQDKTVWAERQRALGVAADGVPGPATMAALRAQGYADGIWAAGKGASALTWALILVVGAAAAYGLVTWSQSQGGHRAA